MIVYDCQMDAPYSIQNPTVDCNCTSHESEHHTVFFHFFHDIIFVRFKLNLSGSIIPPPLILKRRFSFCGTCCPHVASAFITVTYRVCYSFPCALPLKQQVPHIPEPSNAEIDKWHAVYVKEVRNVCFSTQTCPSDYRGRQSIK